MDQLSESQKVYFMTLSETERVSYLDSYKESLNVTYLRLWNGSLYTIHFYEIRSASRSVLNSMNLNGTVD